MTKLGVSYYGNRFLSHARDDIRRMATFNDYVVHTVSETDLTFHKAVLARIFNESRKANLEVWADPWGLGGVFGGEAFSKFLPEHRDSWQIMSDGRVMPSACLNRPEFRSYMMEWVLSVRDMGAQVIFWDEPHVAFDFESEWQGVYSCTCVLCQTLFKKKFGVPLPAKMNGDARLFRRETMVGFLEDMLTFAKSKGLKNALCLYAFKGHAEFDLLWEAAANNKDLDIIGCDPYWRWRGHQKPGFHVGEFSKHVVNLAKKQNKGSQVWIQAMRLPAGAEGEIEEACLAAVKEGVSHIAAWSFDGGELLDPVLSESPERVVQVLEKTYHKIRALG